MAHRSASSSTGKVRQSIVSGHTARRSSSKRHVYRRDHQIRFSHVGRHQRRQDTAPAAPNLRGRGQLSQIRSSRTIGKRHLCGCAYFRAIRPSSDHRTNAVGSACRRPSGRSTLRARTPITTDRAMALLRRLGAHKKDILGHRQHSTPIRMFSGVDTFVVVDMKGQYQSEPERHAEFGRR